MAGWIVCWDPNYGWPSFILPPNCNSAFMTVISQGKRKHNIKHNINNKLIFSDKQNSSVRGLPSPPYFRKLWNRWDTFDNQKTKTKTKTKTSPKHQKWQTFIDFVQKMCPKGMEYVSTPPPSPYFHPKIHNCGTQKVLWTGLFLPQIQYLWDTK